MIVIDGSRGEGGGQIFRSSLTLAMCLRKNIKIINIRAGRKKPGLLRQHLACLKAAEKICSAKVVGDQLGCQEVVFSPGNIRAGEYVFAVGSAGSTTLIFQTILSALAMADHESHITFKGGTHNGMAPSYDFIAQCFIPTVRAIGYQIESNIERYGFYPSGGGRWNAIIKPHRTSKALYLLERSKICDMEAVVTQAKIPEHIAERELKHIESKLNINKLKYNIVDSHGSGNILSLRLSMNDITEVFEQVGEIRVSAERVASKVVDKVREYLSSSAPVGEYLADQLIIPMLLNKGGSFRTFNKSLHLSTNIDIVNQIAGELVKLTHTCETQWQVSIHSI
ncbi:RNA 3'-terminal phosphate cyclase [Agarilytica rhodophyticola]|uniref:RNA 3'-terminal phosphate cyclase n=1 Tax=Agarilytica rhodophyticola TaxID=1737490 RepID=UPI000B349456|nr:RNA 3'-terminal phosphate cyclase [Agarilytica rhodophyticola]